MVHAILIPPNFPQTSGTKVNYDILQSSKSLGMRGKAKKRVTDKHSKLSGPGACGGLR